MLCCGAWPNLGFWLDKPWFLPYTANYKSDSTIIFAFSISLTTFRSTEFAMVSWCCSLSTLWRGARENLDKSPGPLNKFNSLILVMCIMHSPTTGIWYYVHVPFRSLKFWFITGRTISHPVWHPFFLSLRTACKLWREWTHATDPTSDMNWPVQIFYVVLTVSLAVKSSSSASHNQGPRLVANHHSMRQSAGVEGGHGLSSPTLQFHRYTMCWSHELQVHVIDTTRRYIDGDSSPSWHPRCVRLHAFFFGFPVYSVCTLRQSHVIICIIVS